MSTDRYTKIIVIAITKCIAHVRILFDTYRRDSDLDNLRLTTLENNST